MNLNRTSILDQYFDQHTSITGIKFKFSSSIFLKESSAETSHNDALSSHKSQQSNDIGAISDSKLASEYFAQKQNLFTKYSPKLNDFNLKPEASVLVQGTQVHGSKAVIETSENKKSIGTAPFDYMQTAVPPPINQNSSKLYPKIQFDLIRSLEIGQKIDAYQICKKDIIQDSIQSRNRLIDNLSDMPEPSVKFNRKSIYQQQKIQPQTLPNLDALKGDDTNPNICYTSNKIRKISSETVHTDQGIFQPNKRISKQEGKAMNFNLAKVLQVSKQATQFLVEPTVIMKKPFLGKRSSMDSHQDQ